MTSTYQTIAPIKPPTIENHAPLISTGEVTYVFTSHLTQTRTGQYRNFSSPWQGAAILHREDWGDSEFREGYLEGAVEQTIAWQVRVNREARNLSQRELAKKVGTQQSAISRLEDPTNGNLNIKTLLKVANAFECALSVRLISYAQLAEDSKDLSSSALTVSSYDQDFHFYSTIKNGNLKIAG